MISSVNTDESPGLSIKPVFLPRLLPLLLLLALHQPSVYADELRLKSGERLSGRLIEGSEGLFTLATPEGPLRLDQSEIEWIVRGSDAEIEKKRRAAGHFYDAEILYHKRQYIRAAWEYQKAIDLLPRDADLVNNLGTCYIKAGESKRAIKAYHSALKINPDHAATLNNLARAYLEEKNFTAAREQLEKAEKLSPKDSVPAASLGIVFYRSAEYTKSISAFERALLLGGADPDVLNNLGLAHLAAGNSLKAREYFTEALSIRPGHVKAAANLERLNKALENKKTLS